MSFPTTNAKEFIGYIIVVFLIGLVLQGIGYGIMEVIIFLASMR